MQISPRGRNDGVEYQTGMRADLGSDACYCGESWTQMMEIVRVYAVAALMAAWGSLRGKRFINEGGGGGR